MSKTLNYNSQTYTLTDAQQLSLQDAGIITADADNVGQFRLSTSQELSQRTRLALEVSTALVDGVKVLLPLAPNA